jgi:hypothetical protein
MVDQTNCYICKNKIEEVIYDFEEGINLYEFCSKDCLNEYFKNHLSDDCILAIQQTKSDYKEGIWNGQNLHVFYETRDMTPAQVKAIYYHEMLKVEQNKKHHPEHHQKFIESGELNSPIEHEVLIKGVEEVHPDVARFPLNNFLRDLSEETGDKFEATWIIKRNGVKTWVYVSELTNLWSSLLKFNTKQDAYMLLLEMAKKRLGLVKRTWWQFWR